MSTHTTTGSFETLAVGDLVVITNANFGSRKVRVEKVGRVNIFVGKESFDRKTGRAKNAGSLSHLELVEKYEMRVKVAAAHSKLRRFGVDVRGDAAKVFAVLQALQHLLD